MSLRALQAGFREWLTNEARPAPLCAARFEAGLSIYLNNYRAQLMDCLQESYGTVHAWLGDAAFEAAAATHIDRAAPTNWTLDAYGADFAVTLRRLYPGDPEVADLAVLEHALAQAFTAPDVAAVDPASLGAIDWDHARLHFTPSLTLLTTTSNAAAIWSALSQGTPPPAAQPLPEPTTILVWREGFTPAFRTLDPAEGRALVGLKEGQTFGAFCAELVAHVGEEAGPAMAGAYLRQWLSDSIVAEIAATEL
jgi:hypothetical protein